MTNFKFDDIFSTVKDQAINQLSEALGDINSDIKIFLLNTFSNLIQFYNIDPKIYSYSPFINGRYVIFMTNGPWFEKAFNYFEKGEYLFSQAYGNDSQYSFDSGNNRVSFFKKIFPILATDIDIPEITKEYINISTRSQTISNYQKELLIPDFSMTFLEDRDLNIIRYYEYWHKAIELYRRGILGPLTDDKKTNKILRYFYDIPYTNAIWVMLFDITFNVRGLFYLPGVRPVSLPLKQVLGSRSTPKIALYNIQHKGTILFYKFFKDNKDFSEQLQNNNSTLLKQFKKLYNNK